MDIKTKIAGTIKRIRAIRESKNLSQEQMGKKLGLSQNAYSKIEIGKTEITLERLYQIAEIFEQPATYLITGDDGANH